MEKAIQEAANGYAAWLEPSHLHFHSGGMADVRAYWGRMMQREGRGEPDKWRAVVVDPAGNRAGAAIEQGEGPYHVLGFQAEQEGLYTVVLENSPGISGTMPEENCLRHLQWARLDVPVGHHVHGTPPAAIGDGLDIVPGHFLEYMPGDKINLTVLYKGEPLPGAEVKATNHLFTGTGYPLSGITGPRGEVSLTFNAKGHWMFIVTHTDHSDRKAGEYHGTVYTTTLVVPGVR
ncbi:hypothetical protein DCCM_2718 [Desulfocucumis palustris]|uniref:DUF4198 domain-containing protein n=1 Tax=Desulfocucumis palustris TaxID=1898651 RepID=A0A2L2XBZ4_9FIRM|nr:DUF4198 domain-containing protein [Desulfocucumis palustris]GBF33612.1 hypothetical protein DCCM_2718 [Desulfocucumis palustris]